MKRLAAMQDWPLLMVRAFTAMLTARWHIGAGHDDERIAAAQFQHGFLDALAGLRGHLHAGGFAAGQRDRHHARVVDHARHLLGADQ